LIFVISKINYWNINKKYFEQYLKILYSYFILSNLLINIMLKEIIKNVLVIGDNLKYYQRQIQWSVDMV